MLSLLQIVWTVLKNDHFSFSLWSNWKKAVKRDYINIDFEMVVIGHMTGS